MKHLYPDENGLFYDDNVLNCRRRVLRKWFDEDENKLSFYLKLPSRSKFYKSYCFYRLLEIPNKPCLTWFKSLD